MVSQLPHLRLFISPSNSELKSLTKAYLGLPDTARVNLESAFTALSNPGSEDLLDRDSVLINLLRCWLQILGDKEARGDIKPEDLFKLLATCETALISVQSSPEGRQIRRKLRICGKTTINDFLPKLDADYASIPWSILDALSVYFEGLLGIARKGNQVPENEDLDVLRIYSPLMQQIFLYKPHFWEGVSSFTLLGSHFPEELLKRRTASSGAVSGTRTDFDIDPYEKA
ncbi:hypothetical protein FRC05_008642 [Tulasnella sp. 425]|nr:hypothetical protein FRC05_008642 [Tulasnella sp. 425]